MRKSQRLVCVVLLIACVSVVASASATVFTGAMDNTWGNPDNWDTLAAPTAADDAWVSGATVDLGGVTRNAKSLIMGDATLQNGTLNFVDTAHLQPGAVVDANLTNVGGTGRVWVDYGGTVTLGGNNGVTGGTSTVIGYSTASTVMLATATGLNAAGEFTDVYKGTLDLNGQGIVRTGGIRLVGGADSFLTNTSAAEARVDAWIGLKTGCQIGGNAGSINLPGRLYDGAAGPQSLTKVGTDQLWLWGDNNYTGDTIVNGGALIHMNGASLCDTADVRMAPGSYMALVAAGTDTVNALYFDGLMQAAGTWGSSTSGAQYVNDTYFQAGFNGMLNVTVGVPEPSAIVLVATGVFGLLAYAWRKRK